MNKAFLYSACLACLTWGCGNKDAATDTSATAGRGTTEMGGPAAPSAGAGTSTPGTPITEVDMSDLGVKLYPGAYTTAELGGVSKLEMDGKTTVTGRFFSTDPVKKIYDFYKTDLKGAGGLPPGTSAGAIFGKNTNGDEVNVTIARDEEQKLTAIIIEAKKKW